MPESERSERGACKESGDNVGSGAGRQSGLAATSDTGDGAREAAGNSGGTGSRGGSPQHTGRTRHNHGDCTEGGPSLDPRTSKHEHDRGGGDCHGNVDAEPAGKESADHVDGDASSQPPPEHQARPRTQEEPNRMDSTQKSVITGQMPTKTAQVADATGVTGTTPVVADMGLPGGPQLGMTPADSASNIKRETSFLKTVHQQAKETQVAMSPQQPTPAGKSPMKKKKIKKSICVSYSPDAGFVEKKFIVESVRQFKENNLSEDIWFDKDEKNIDSPSWFSQRIEAVERCQAAIVFLSEGYFHSPISVYEAKVLFDRHQMDAASVKVFPILYGSCQEVNIPRTFQKFFTAKVDLTEVSQIKKSIAEKASIVVGTLMMDLESLASVNVPAAPFTPPDTDFTGEYKKKMICQWGTNDLQEWLFKLGVKEFYRQSLAENMVDGYLLMSMKDHDLLAYLGIDNRVVRKKIMQQILASLDREHKLPENWHLRARMQRAKPNSIYLIYDPTDLRLAQNLKHDLSKKKLQVLHHQKLGTSKEEFLQLNGPQMAGTTSVLVILTEAATNSPFVFHEILFADWLGKKVITAMFCNTWSSLRPSLKAVLGDCPSVDFERELYRESLDVLEHHIKPLRAVPGVVLEQSFLTKMAEGIKPLAKLALDSKGGSVEAQLDLRNTKVFISFQWDVVGKVEDIRAVLEGAGFQCWADIGTSMGAAGSRGQSGLCNRTGHGDGNPQVGVHLADQAESLATQIQCNMKAAGLVLSCVTPKYMQSDNCVKDLTLAESLRKPIIPVMLRFCHWPPEGAPNQVRKILVKYVPIDLSNDKLFKQNLNVLLDRIKKLTGNK